MREATALRALPPVLPRACVVLPAQINKFSEITYQTNRYSVPTRYAHRMALVEVYDHRLRIIVEEHAVAEHPRAPGRDGLYLDPRHFLELLTHKHRAAMGAAVLADRRLPQAFLDLRARYLERDQRGATKAWMSVVSLLSEHPADVVAEVISHAMARGTDDAAAIALLLHQRTSATLVNAKLDLRAYPHVPAHLVEAIDLQAYDELAERAS